MAKSKGFYVRLGVESKVPGEYQLLRRKLTRLKHASGASAESTLLFALKSARSSVAAPARATAGGEK